MKIEQIPHLSYTLKSIKIFEILPKKERYDIEAEAAAESTIELAIAGKQAKERTYTSWRI